MVLSRFFLSLGILTALVSTSYAAIKDVKTMEEALAPVDAETLLIFDLDNTIMETVQTLGSDQWFEYFVHKTIAGLIQAGKPEEQAKEEGLREALAVWKSVQRVTLMQPVEAVTVKLIEEKQKAGIKIMGLTARPVDLAETSRNQLKRFGVDLSVSPISKEDVVLQKAKDVNFVSKYEKGILFSGNNKKGEMLVRFLKKIGKTPAKIVFVDDKQKNVDSVEKSLNELGGILHTSMRYGAADEKVAKFDQRLAETQHAWFGKILSDSAAQALSDE